MKKFLSLIAVPFIACSVALCSCGDDDGGGNNTDGEQALSFTAVEENGRAVAYTVKDIGTVTGTDISIPAEHNGLPVTGIAENAFGGCNEIESVTIGGNIKEIGKSAFARCESLKSVSVGSVEQWCNITFANTGASPMYFASEFYVGNNLVSELVIPDSVTKIPDLAFYGCSNITSVKTGGDVTEIGGNAFYGCEKLASVQLEGKITAMGENAFADCSAIKNLTIGNGVGIIGEYAFLNCGAIEKVTIPSSVRRIEEGAFLGCSGIKEVKMNEGLQYIGDCAFSGCASLAEFIMPSSVTGIGEYGVLMFGADYGFAGGADSFNQVGKIVLSDNLTEIPDFSFSYCGIKTITIGSKVEQISYSSFYGCERLESIVIPQSVKKIESYAFYKCPMLNTVFYTGTAEEWQEIKIGKNGNAITTAAVYYFSEAKPAEAGSFWHYDGNGTPVIW